MTTMNPRARTAKPRTRTTNGRFALGAVCVGSVFAVGVAVGALSTTGDLVDAVDVSPRHRVMADCLWPTARNHGFLNVQDAALDAGVDRDGRTLWLTFLESTGTDACDYDPTDLASLTNALRDTRAAAVRHFTKAR